MLICEQLALSYETSLFTKLNFELRPGSALVLRGANGSGKTTLLRHLALLKPAEKGEVFWHNEAIYDSKNYKAQICYIGHKLALKQELTVQENLEIWTKLRNMEELLAPALAFFDLLPLFNIKVALLSAGWQKKIALARLLAANAKIWLLDEPETNLDTAAINKLCDLIEARINQNAIVIIASHNMQLYRGYPKIQLEDFS